MRNLGILLLFCLAGSFLPGLVAESAPPPVRVATSFPAVDIHGNEQVAIAAEPYENQEKAKLFKVDFLKHGFLPVRLIVTNNSDRPISLRDARILFETAAGERLQAAVPADVERRMAHQMKMNNGLPLPLPIPIPSIGSKPKNDNKKIESDFDTFEFAALVVEAHTTRAGFLFYDLSEVDAPEKALPGAKLILRKVRNADGAELFSFEIPFELYLRAKTAHMQ